jgi:Flp pilus assembly pilin Flp
MAKSEDVFMISKKQVFKHQEHSERGASLVEYALLVALIAVAAATVLGTLGTNVANRFEGIATTIGNAGTTTGGGAGTTGGT